MIRPKRWLVVGVAVAISLLLQRFAVWQAAALAPALVVLPLVAAWTAQRRWPWAAALVTLGELFSRSVGGVATLAVLVPFAFRFLSPAAEEEMLSVKTWLKLLAAASVQILILTAGQFWTIAPDFVRQWQYIPYGALLASVVVSATAALVLGVVVHSAAAVTYRQTIKAWH